MTVRLVLADDQPAVRLGFRTLVELGGDLVVVGEAADGEEAVAVVRRERPDVVLMDVRMPVLDGLAATRRIVADPALADVRVVVLTTFDDEELLLEALRSGASGFLLKDVDADELHRGIRAVADGHGLLSPAVTRRVVEHAVARSGPPLDDGRLAALTDRERGVLALVATGATNQEIAAELVMSPLTAKTHVSRILTKLGARDRAALVVIAYETGLVTPG